MTPRRIPQRASRAVGALALVVGVSGCSVTVDDLPLPSPGAASDSYSLDITFANALNLPTSAKVKLAGADVGEVRSMRAENYTAIVTVDIDSDVELPVGTTAELRSATPIGDVFVGLTAPADAAPGGPVLADGGTIGVQQTAAASTIEDLLTRAALIVNGGSIRNLTQLVNGLGERVGDRGQRVGELLDETTRLVGSLNSRSGQIQQALTQATELSRTLNDGRVTLEEAVSAAGPALTVIGDNTQNIVDIVGRLNAVSEQLGKFPSIAGTGGRSMAADINALAAGLNAGATAPMGSVKATTDNIQAIAKITSSQTAHIDVDVAQLALGAVPDPNFPGSTASEIPDAADAANLVGSITYSLNRLRDKVMGPSR